MTPAKVLRLLLSFATMFVFCNCVSSPRVVSAQPGKVANWKIIKSNEKVSGAGAIFGAAHGGLIGSTIGRGTSAGIIGAISVGLLEGYLFHRAEKRNAEWSKSWVQVKLDHGGGTVVVINDKATDRWHIGEPVLVTYDKHGSPIDVIKVSSALGSFGNGTISVLR